MRRKPCNASNPPFVDFVLILCHFERHVSARRQRHYLLSMGRSVLHQPRPFLPSCRTRYKRDPVVELLPGQEMS
jgi:hypothetical protein